MSLEGGEKPGKKVGVRERTVSGRGKWREPARGLYEAGENARGMESTRYDVER